MLTRKQIFGGGMQSDILVRQMTVTPPPLRKHAPDVPAALDAAIMAALAKNPLARPQTALAFAERVSRAIGRELAWPAAFRTIARPTPVALRTMSGRPLVLRRERPPLWRVAAIGVAAATLLTGAVVAARRRADVPQVEAASSAPAAAPAGAEAKSPTALVTVLLQSVPEGAEIVEAGERRLGVTPFNLVLPAGDARQVTFRKAGFRPVERSFEALTDTTIAVRLDPAARPARAKARARRRLAAPSTTIDPFGQAEAR
jgi:hypothetical protein